MQALVGRGTGTGSRLDTPPASPHACPPDHAPPPQASLPLRPTPASHNSGEGLDSAWGASTARSTPTACVHLSVLVSTSVPIDLLPFF